VHACPASFSLVLQATMQQIDCNRRTACCQYGPYFDRNEQCSHTYRAAASCHGLLDPQILSLYSPSSHR
jgi:hypothetical protein